MQEIIISLVGGMLAGFAFAYYPVIETKSKLISQETEIAKCNQELTETKAINQGMMLNK